MKKVFYILVCTLLIAATVVPVTGTMKEEVNSIVNDDVINYDINDFVKYSGREKIPIESSYDAKGTVPAYKKASLDAPGYEFVQEPTAIMMSYYDYMPGSYVTHPIRVQTGNGDGHYLTFFARPTKSGDRRQYYGYYDNDGNVQDWGEITSYDTWQGYGGIGIHPATGDCIATWHEDDDGDGTFETAITYDDFYAAGVPGDWQKTEIVSSSTNNEFIWPHIQVGPSPLGTGYVRIYQITTNAENTPAGIPCEDVRLMYIDVEDSTSADLSDLLDKNNWDTVKIFTNWRPKSCRPFQSFAIDHSNPGKVAFIGDAAWVEGDLGNMPVDEGVFVWESLDYGETWDTANLHSDGPGTPLYQVGNPGFEDAPSELDVTIAGWHGTALYDSNGDLHWTYLQSYGYSDEAGSYYFPNFMPQAEVVWDGSSFTFREVPELPGTDPLSGHSVPWGGEYVYPVIGWSSYRAGLFHENTQKNAVNLDNNWMAQMWVDSTYHQLAVDGDPTYVEYEKHPIILISISNDNGETWFDPIEVTDIFSDKFDFSEQITVYPYMCDQIVDIGDDWGQIIFYYFDDNSFHSTVQGTGMDPTGQITYCSIKVMFSDNLAPSTPTVRYEQSSDTLVVSSTDPDGDQIRYGVSWNNDGNIDEWTDLHDSGVDVSIDCGDREGTVGVIAEDENGAQSDWVSATPKNKLVINSLIARFLDRIANAFPILRHLLKI
jgi:hypothetical protein